MVRYMLLAYRRFQAQSPASSLKGVQVEGNVKDFLTWEILKGHGQSDSADVWTNYCIILHQAPSCASRPQERTQEVSLGFLLPRGAEPRGICFPIYPLSGSIPPSLLTPFHCRFCPTSILPLESRNPAFWSKPGFLDLQRLSPRCLRAGEAAYIMRKLQSRTTKATASS